jgi:low temperature requirement protein LtrA
MAHGLQRMTGRDRGEHGRASTPLELLYDLTVVVAISLAGGQLAYALTSGHVWAGIAAFCFVMFAIVWAWLSYSWFASAFDTDDWFLRLATLVQMIGVLVIGLGVSDIFVGIEEDHLDNALVVGGYVIMRLALVALWARVAKESPEHAAAARAYIKVIVVAQIG